LLQAVEITGAQKVFVTHGFQSVLSRYLTEKGIESHEVKTAFGTEDNNPENDMETESPTEINTIDPLAATPPTN
jgi:putative mRNA 3-end processing factor